VRAHQFDTVRGSCHGSKAVPVRYAGQGSWRGEEPGADIRIAHAKD